MEENSLAVVNSRAADDEDNSNITCNDFPPTFVFGVATAAYQVEGGAAKGGRGPSIWDTFTLRTPGRISDGSNGNVATDMEGIDYYNAVINTVIEHGLEPYVTIFHFDLPSALQEEYGGFLSKKILPDFREYAELCFWEFGDRVKYWITINEPSSYCVNGYAAGSFPPAQAPTSAYLSALTPQISEDLVSAQTPAANADLSSTPPYVRPALTSLLRSASSATLTAATNVPPTKGVVNDPVHLVSTFRSSNINNQNLYGSISSYDPKHVYIAARNMLLAHAEAVHSYKDKFQNLFCDWFDSTEPGSGTSKGKIGITLCCVWYEPLNEDDQNDIDAHKRAMDFLLGWIELLYIYLCANDPDPTAEDGYYRDMHVKFDSFRDNVPIGPLAGSSWLRIVPWGIRKLLYIQIAHTVTCRLYTSQRMVRVDEKNDYKLIACDACVDPVRIKYHQDHFAEMLKAMKDEHNPVDVRGYFVWAWCDNFEWAAGYTVRFGLIYIDYLNNYTRYPKQSAVWFSKFLVRKKLLVGQKRQITDVEESESGKRLKLTAK
ncbi:Raucaffricine-O-beta-D-glucosidase [Sesamum angolense]|uniref:Raucaffricine-O-beta-D-glucosidase n=1 Tax=Sesamum angolense TaxID=2727404 RepID=A0AAE1WLG3_9LAMI|nr:Raucaffricine-O-beta-D-glucosidase [Sesamum angolense]